jgi:long-chain acyl-CoA synthetase
MDWSAYAIPPMRYEARFGDRVVPCFADRPRSLHDLVAGASARNPDGEAFVAGGARITWRAFDESVRRVSTGLATLGVEAGDRVALLLGNRIEFVFAMFGAAHLGAIGVPLSIRQQKPEIAYVLNDCGAKLIVHQENLADRLPDPYDVPSLRTRVSTGETMGSPRFADLLEATPRTEAKLVDEEDTALILYTSGTTGRPKGALLAHCNIIHSAMIFEACMELTAGDRSIAAVPLAHVTGIVANIAAMARCAGVLIILPEFKASDYLAATERERATHSLMVPAMYNLCLLQADFDRHDLTAWRIGGYGGAPMPSATISRLGEKLPGLKLVNAYGATETTSPSTIMPPAFTATHADSVGLPCPGARIVVVDDAGCELPRGEVGELWIRSGSVVKGYWNNATATRESFTGGFWHSGDLGSIDRDDFVRVLDRKKDMINRGGHKIYSAEVEAVLASHPDVVESAVVARPCPVLGERVHAFVVTRGQTDAEALKSFCARQVSDYKVPETITLRLEPLPRNANGKVMKRVLREEIESVRTGDSAG